MTTGPAAAERDGTAKARIAHLSGPRATIQNTPPLVTSNKAREKHGLSLRLNADGSRPAFDGLRPQRLAAPVTVYIEQFSAHPLEADAAELYGPPDGYLDPQGAFHRNRTATAVRPVYEVELRPEDGLYLLPYMATQADGRAWEEECAIPGAPEALARQGFYPDGSRVFEEIDRLSLGDDGMASLISSVATVDFVRVAPPGGYTKGLPAHRRTDTGEGDIAPEQRGRDFFPYKPFHLAAAPTRPLLAKFVNDTQATVSSGSYDGVIWTQGSPQIEEGAYWLSLLIDTGLPICLNAAQRSNGVASNDGPRNIVDSVSFIASRVWADESGRNRFGAVVIQDQIVFAARDVAKVDARPGGFAAMGGHGGILGQFSHVGRFAFTYLPAYKHTHSSDVNITRLPASTQAVKMVGGVLGSVVVAIKDALGNLLPDAIPSVSILKDGSYSESAFAADPAAETDLIASIEGKLAAGRLAGFVVEGVVPIGGSPSQVRERLTFRATLCGLPVVRVVRGGAEAFADRYPYCIAGSNLTATKARLLLMACLMKFGCLPFAADPDAPAPSELTALREALASYQAVFDSH